MDRSEAARILKPETVALMSSNQIGPIGVPALRDGNASAER